MERCSGANCADFRTVAQVGPNVTTYNDVALSSNTTYTYRVRAFNNDGGSGYSNLAVATTSEGPPIAPQSLAARAIKQGGRVSIELSWNDQSSDEMSFELERCRGTNCSDFALLTVIPANTTAFSDRSVSRRSLYRYRVRAGNGLLKSNYSNIASATTQ